MSFIKGLPEDENDRTVAAAVISLGQKLKLRVIAEGVETAEQADYLRRNSCDEIQGDKAASLSGSAAPFQSYGRNFTPMRRTPTAPPSPAPWQPPGPGSAPNLSADRQFAESPQAAPRTPDILGLFGGQEGVPFPSARVQFSMSPVTQLRRPAAVCSSAICPLRP